MVQPVANLTLPLTRTPMMETVRLSMAEAPTPTQVWSDSKVTPTIFEMNRLSGTLPRSTKYGQGQL